ncbi:spore protease YyaC [Alteribacter natronophilus]|uniref:spore protease YyaC n=1 Tax=Alteribacter natronophilus TaxID=2583810 RepID=UPI00110D6C3E|nr:spore protease YyaC [Alteribacter natronophilus]TMW72015.1 spore protease YyaC [Alteribacter natronophilus]
MMFRGQLFKNRRQTPYRIHVKETHAAKELAAQVRQTLTTAKPKELIVVCIGSDRSTGDSLGPLIGSRLEESGLDKWTVYGTLSSPVHAVNLEETLEFIELNHKNPYIIAVDACLGRSTSVGYICLGEGPLKPGSAVNKKLPPVGDIHLTGIVNVGGVMEMMVLQNTRLSVVMEMAGIMSEAIVEASRGIPSPRKRFSWSPLPPPAPKQQG